MYCIFQDLCQNTGLGTIEYFTRYLGVSVQSRKFMKESYIYRYVYKYIYIHVCGNLHSAHGRDVGFR